MSNNIHIINPYYLGGVWMFDDSARGLIREPFCGDINRMINLITEDIYSAQDEFLLYFSANIFPGSTHILLLDGLDPPGAWYTLCGTTMRGWLCGALFKFFDSAPKKIYVKAEVSK